MPFIPDDHLTDDQRQQLLDNHARHEQLVFRGELLNLAVRYARRHPELDVLDTVKAWETWLYAPEPGRKFPVPLDDDLSRLLRP